jgi:hypothetical protein
MYNGLVKIGLFLAITVLAPGPGNLYAQVIKKDTLRINILKKDTAWVRVYSIKKDSLRIFKEIKRIADKRKWTKKLYKEVFIDPEKPKKSAEEMPSPKSDYYIRYQGRIIREIYVKTLDPFGATVYDSEGEPVTIFEKWGNELHIKTKSFAVKNQLLFSKGDPLDPLLLRESERILRQSSHVRDARVIVKPLKNNLDTVDVLVILQDVWSITGSANASTTAASVTLSENNFLGIAHQISNTYTYQLDEEGIFNGSYSVPYIKNTFVRGSANYNIQGPNYNLGGGFNREFYSPLTKWAGGANYYRSFQSNVFVNGEDQLKPLVFHQQDYWLGRSFSILGGNSDINRGTRLVMTSRILDSRYSSRPNPDPGFSYETSTLTLASIGVSQRNFYKDNYIFRFGIMEDVPEGRLFSIISGVDRRESGKKGYAGFLSAFQNRYDGLGYISFAIEYGTFIKDFSIEKGVLRADMGYFSDLLSFKRWRVRQFAYLNFTKGINRDQGEYININGDNGLYGFNNSAVSGNSKAFLNLQTVSYLPYTLLGFHFAPVLFGGLGMIGYEERTLFRSPVYEVYGLGILMRNENLIFSTIRISLAFYPDAEGSQFKFNPSVYNLRFRDLFLSKPSTISYY